jgi:hypothetical protein
MLRPEIVRVAMNPMDDEKDWEADEVAGEVFNGLGGGGEKGNDVVTG